MPPPELDYNHYPCCDHRRQGYMYCPGTHPHTSPCSQCQYGDGGNAALAIADGSTRAAYDGTIWVHVQGSWRQIITALQPEQLPQTPSAPTTLTNPVPIAVGDGSSAFVYNDGTAGPGRGEIVLGNARPTVDVNGELRINGRSLDDIVGDRLREVLGLRAAATPEERQRAVEDLRRAVGAPEPREIKLDRLARTKAMLARRSKE